MKNTVINFLSSALSISVLVLAASISSGDAEAETFVDLDDPKIIQALSFRESDYPQVYCMALNVYYEARSSNLADQYAVADVVLNRVEDTRYPNTICEVVKEGYKNADGSMKRNKCQFSWYCDGKSDKPVDQQSWKRAQSIAWDMVKWNNYRGITEGSTHYHTTYVNPRWNKSRKGWSITRVGRIGAHVYYRWN